MADIRRDSQSIAAAWPLIEADIERIVRRPPPFTPPSTPKSAAQRIPPRAYAVLEEVALEYDLRVKDLSSRKRNYRVTGARHEACRRLWALRGRGNWPSGPHIAAWLGFANGNTVYWTLRRLKAAP